MKHFKFVLALAIIMPTMMLAQTLPPLAHSVVDQVQSSLAEWVEVTVTSGFFAFVAWIGNKLKIKITERLNREAIQDAISNYSNSIIDELQKRLGQPEPAPIQDLVNRGVKYVREGSPDAIRELPGLDLNRLGVQVEAGLRKKAAEALSGRLVVIDPQ